MDSAERTTGLFVAKLRAGKSLMVGDSSVVTVGAVNDDSVLLDIREAEGGLRSSISLLAVGARLQLLEGPIELKQIAAGKAHLVVEHRLESHVRVAVAG